MHSFPFKPKTKTFYHIEFDFDTTKRAQIEWFHKDTVISTRETLSIDNVHASDEGEYHCVAINEYGTNSTQFNLTVLSKLLTFLLICTFLFFIPWSF